MSDDDKLTFAEAMALDPGEVEFTFKQGTEVGPVADWLALKDHLGIRFDHLRECGFRRARPRRSRVQEMAEQFAKGDHLASLLVAGCFSAWGEQLIRAVCEYLNKRSFNDARDIEREFLEPR